MRKLIATPLVMTFCLLAGMAGAQLEFWTTEVEPARLAVQNSIAAAFEETSGISVTVVPVEEDVLGRQAALAYGQMQLPDVILHTLSHTHGWAAAGVLDTAAATSLILELDPATFSTSSLDLTADGSGWTAVPATGWGQLMLYRADLFEQAGLEPPDSFDAIRAALHHFGQMPGMSAAAVPTAPGLYLLQVLVHLLMAGGVHLVDTDGNVNLDSPETIAVLELYRELAAAAPEADIDLFDARRLYMSGETAMIFWSPYILDELAGLNDDVPVALDEVHGDGWLAQNTGLLTSIRSESNPAGAGYAEIGLLGITVDADTEAATEFVRFLMTDAYVDFLSLAPEGQIPMRAGTSAGAEDNLDAWLELPIGIDRHAGLLSIYGDRISEATVAGTRAGSRLGIPRGHGVLATAFYASDDVQAVLFDFLGAGITAAEASGLLQAVIKDLLR